MGLNVVEQEHRMFARTAFPSRLINGYRAFLDDRMPIERDRYHELARRGQSPSIMLIGCCDSRVSPEVIFDAHPGELFVVRNIANLVPAFDSSGACHGVFAALEFAVQVLKVEHLVVMGHTHCGGIRAYAENGPPLSPGDSIHQWMSMIAPVAERVGPRTQEDYLVRLEQASISRSLENLMTFPYVAEAVQRQALTLHGAYFDVESGRILVREDDGYVDVMLRESVAVAANRAF
jgi:carbonic anhydrase